MGGLRYLQSPSHGTGRLTRWASWHRTFPGNVWVSQLMNAGTAGGGCSREQGSAHSTEDPWRD
eukprot:13424973-Alexandrium_andersonii.AAC.1